MKKCYRKKLLAGISILAITSFVSPNLLHAANLTAGSDATWASAGGQTSADIANASVDDDICGRE